MDHTHGCDRHGHDPSRRDFLRGSGAAATALVTAPLVGAPDDKPAGGAPTALGPAAVKLSLSVNGHKLTTSVEPRVTLLDALPAAFVACDAQQCGFCTPSRQRPGRAATSRLTFADRTSLECLPCCG